MLKIEVDTDNIGSAGATCASATCLPNEEDTEDEVFLGAITVDECVQSYRQITKMCREACQESGYFFRFA